MEEFTDDQANQILEAVVTNDQIYGIIEDHDVSSFVDRLLKNHEGKLDQVNVKKLDSFRSEAWLSRISWTEFSEGE